MKSAVLLLRARAGLCGAAIAFACASALPVQAGERLAGSALAVEMGCVNCHGAPRGDAPSLQAMAQHFGKYRGQGEAAARRAERLRAVNPAHRIVAHEQLSPETAAQLVLWLADGAP